MQSQRHIAPLYQYLTYTRHFSFPSIKTLARFYLIIDDSQSTPDTNKPGYK